MKYKLNCLLALIVTAFLNSCNMPLCEIAQEQGSEGEEIRLFHGDTESRVPSMNPNYQHLRRGRFFHYHPNDDTVYTKFVMESGPDYGTIITGHIDESVKDSVFLLADRKPLDSIFGPLQTLPCPFDSNSTFLGRPKEPLTNYDDYWKMIKDSQYHDYWILNMKTSDVYGPLTFDEYMVKKKELGVPKDLKLKYER